jgi:hypothetical protein
MSLKLRSLAFTLGTVLVAGPVVAQDLTLVFKETGSRGGDTSSQFFTKERMRHNQADHDTIVEYATGKITNIDHKKKEYFEISLAEMEAQMKAASAEMDKASAQMKQQMENMPPAAREKMEQMMGGATAAVSVTKGGSRKVAGYDCQEYTVAMGQGMKTESCNTTALKFPVPEGELKRFSSLGGAMAGMANNPMFKGLAQMAEKMKEVQGFPLASTTTFSMMGKSTTTSREAVEVKQGPIDESVFALPAGYKKVDPPSMKPRGAKN